MTENGVLKPFVDDTGERLFTGSAHRPEIIYAQSAPECEITINEMAGALRTEVFTEFMPCSSLVSKAFGSRIENGQKKFAIGVAINDPAL